MALSKSEITKLFEMLNAELAKLEERGQLFLLGGAVMCLVYAARPSTNDVDGFFRPSAALRKAAKKVALQTDLPENWLNDAVKGFLSEDGDFEPYLDLSNLSIMVAQPAYLFAMKCLALRIGKEFHDEEDIRFLVKYLGIESYAQALEILERYYPIERFPQKTLYGLEEILGK